MDIFWNRPMVQIVFYEKKKESLKAIKLKEIFTMVWKVQNVQGFVWKTTQPGLGGKSCWHTNPSHFWQPLQSLLWDIRLKICRLTNYCNMLFQVLLTKFSKREPFLLTLSQLNERCPHYYRVHDLPSFSVLVHCITCQRFIEPIFAWSWYTSCFAQIITDTWFDGISCLLSFFFFHGQCDDAC